MTRSERHLAICLRVIGAASLLAVVAVFMPRAWMAWCHEMLGLGPFPDAPVTEYLARSASLFYALSGGVYVFVSLDVRRYARVVTVLAVATIVCGVVLLSIDMRAGMPWWWTVGEGPFVVAVGIAILLLQVRARSETEAADRAGERPGADARTDAVDTGSASGP